MAAVGLAVAVAEAPEADANSDADAAAGFAGGGGACRAGLLDSLTAFFGWCVEYILSCVKWTLENSARFDPAQSLVPASDIMVVSVTSAERKKTRVCLWSYLRVE